MTGDASMFASVCTLSISKTFGVSPRRGSATVPGESIFPYSPFHATKKEQFLARLDYFLNYFRRQFLNLLTFS
jgi:hypothetical protein